MVAITARKDSRATRHGLQTVQVIGSLSRPRAAFYRTASFVSQRFEPRAVAAAIPQAKDLAQRMDMSLEMLDIQALDTGQYHAMVVQDPIDKRNITGFFHFVRAYSNAMRHTQDPGYDECEERQVYALNRLATYISECTDIRTDVSGANVPLDSDEIFKVPWVYLGTYWPFQLTVSELKHLGRYLAGGGFLFVEAMGHPSSAAEASFRNVFAEALAYKGIKDLAFQRIPNSHPMYHCYFDFDGPPMEHRETGYGRPYLAGLLLERGRLVGIISRKWYANAWGDWGPGGYRYPKSYPYAHLDPTRPLQFGVNLIVFALTQEGSITHRVMNMVR